MIVEVDLKVFYGLFAVVIILLLMCFISLQLIWGHLKYEKMIKDIKAPAIEEENK